MAIGPNFLKIEFENTVNKTESVIDTGLVELGSAGCLGLDPIVLGPREPHLRYDRDYLAKIENDLTQKYLKAGWAAALFKIEWKDDQRDGSWWQIQWKMEPK
jgi:hypothetical protein